MNNKEIRYRLEELIYNYRKIDRSFAFGKFTDKFTSSEKGIRKTHEELMKLKPFVMEIFGEEKDANLDDILKDIRTKDIKTLSEIENIVRDYIYFVNEVVGTYRGMFGYSIYEKTEKELEVEEKGKKSKSKSKKDLEIN